MCTIFDIGLCLNISSLFASTFMEKCNRRQWNLLQKPAIGWLKKGLHIIYSLSTAIKREV